MQNRLSRSNTGLGINVAPNASMVDIEREKTLQGNLASGAPPYIVGVEETSQGRSSSSRQALPEIREGRAASITLVRLCQWKTKHLLTCGM